MNTERQMNKKLSQVRYDHVERYAWASSMMDLGGHINDVACGTGYGCYLMSKKNFLVRGYDRSDEALAVARKYFSNHKTTYLKADINSLLRTMPEAGFLDVADYFTCFETLEHVKHPDLLLRDAARNTNAFGFFSVPNEEVYPFNPDKTPEHVRHYTPEQFATLLRANGWEIVSLHGQQGRESPVYPVKGFDSIKDLRYFQPRTLIAMARPRVDE